MHVCLFIYTQHTYNVNNNLYNLRCCLRIKLYLAILIINLMLYIKRRMMLDEQSFRD